MYTSNYPFIYAVTVKYWWTMKKFSDYLAEQSETEGFEKHWNHASQEEKDHILKMFGHLDEQDRQIIRRQLLEQFGNMLGNNKGFVEAVCFVLCNASGQYSKQMGYSMIERATNFFRNPITRGLVYIDGENQVVNAPNPNQNGFTNNSYYN
jgi:hypothetical protein